MPEIYVRVARYFLRGKSDHLKAVSRVSNPLGDIEQSRRSNTNGLLQLCGV